MEGQVKQMRAWWKECSVYQVYPASFSDSTGSGFGDLKGIISRVDYLSTLGVDIVWLSPIFKSPQLDMIDIINFISKNPSFPDSSQRFLRGTEYYACGSRCHEYLQEIGGILKEYDAFSVGEMPCVHDEKEVIKAVAADRAELAMIFHFELMDLDLGVDGKFSPKAWPLSELKTKVNRWQRFMHDNNGWNALYLENHDQPRAVSRFAHDGSEYRQASAKLIAVFLAFQVGTPFIYQGQEIGLTNVPIEWGMEDYKGIDCLNHWESLAIMLELRCNEMIPRKQALQPVQLHRVHDNYKAINVASQVNNPTSVFHMYQLALEKRKKHKDILVYGDFELVDEANEKIFA
ncbi:hypothetical protein E4U59_003535 [Claviceps monticola]|nr:hypothetical protein E4U59_003535 [Claviceps monticola]